MKKKRIVFFLQTMIMGGVEKELITILNKFDKEKFQIDVALGYIQDESVVKMIPNGVNVINLDVNKNYYCAGLKEIIKIELKKFKLLKIIKLIFGRLVLKKQIVDYIDFSKLDNLKVEYDYAVCYHVHSPFSVRFVAEKVNAKNKIAWIHNDFNTTGYRIEKLSNYLSKYDKYVAVSNKVKDEFVIKCPQFGDKTETIYNILDSNEIQVKAQEKEIDESFKSDKRIKLLTVGRLCEQKGYDIAIKTCAKLKREGIDVAWYWIGAGEIEKARELISQLDVKDNFIMLNRKDNPYPYIKHADVFIQPSRHEAYSLSIVEAKILKKYIICSNFAGANEQIQNGVNGVIVDCNNIDQLSSAVTYAIQNKDFYDRIIKTVDYDNYSDNLKKILEIFGE